MKKKFSEKDKKDWNDFLRNEKNVEIKDEDFYLPDIKTQATPKLDLHGFNLIEANNLVKDFIIKFYSKGYKKLLIITGVGSRSKIKDNPYVSENLSILKNSIPEFIKKDDHLKNIVLNISQASLKDGGKGAIYIILKKKL